MHFDLCSKIIVQWVSWQTFLTVEYNGDFICYQANWR